MTYYDREHRERGRGGRRGYGGRRRGRPAEERTTPAQRQQVRAWFSGRLPEEWFSSPVDVQVDDDEILVVGTLPPVALADGVPQSEQPIAEAARIGGFRGDTREQRVRIAEEAETAFGRHVSWGARCGETTQLFTTASVPVMTRLGLSERAVLDTLIDAGVARSRSEALAWCVRLVGRNEEEWIGALRAAFEQVEEVRRRGPVSGPDPAPDSPEG
jgi:hypothetical protein